MRPSPSFPRPVVTATVFLAVVVGAVLLLNLNRPPPLSNIREVDGVFVIEVSGAIDPHLVRRVRRSLGSLERQGMLEVIVVIDSPGGSVAEALELLETIGRSSVRTHGLLGDVNGAAVVMLPAFDHIYCLPHAAIAGIAGPSAPAADPMMATIHRQLATAVRAAAQRKGREPRMFESLVNDDAPVSYTAQEARGAGISDGTFDSVEALVAHVKSSGGSR